MKSFGRWFDSSLSDDAQLVGREDGKNKNRWLSRGHGQQGWLRPGLWKPTWRKASVGEQRKMEERR